MAKRVGVAHDEAFFRDLCENARDLIQSVGADGRFLFVNRAWLETLGYDEGDVSRLRVFDVIHPDDRPHCESLFGDLLRDGGTIDISTNFVTKSGAGVPVEGAVSCRVEDGKTVSTRGIFRDMTESRRAREDRDRLFELSLDVLCVADFHGRFRRVNPSFRRILGWTEQDLDELKFMELVHPDDRARAEAEVVNLPAGRAILDFECRFRTKDDRYKTLVWRATPLPERRLVFVNARDVSEERRMAGVVARTSEELDRFFSMSLDMLCVAGTDGFFKRVNPAFELVLGYSRDELLSRQFIDFIHPEDRQKTVDEVSKLARGEPTVDFENRYRARDGSWHWLQWRAAPLPEEGLIYAIARDTTEQVRLKRQLVQQAAELARSNAELEQFASVASHDLQAPLRQVGRLARWTEEGLPGDASAEVRKNLEKLRQRVARMERMTADLLRYARAGSEHAKLESVDTGKLVDEIVDTLSPPPGFSVSTADGMPVIETERGPLEQVLRNLISNAIAHHDREKGTIEISGTAIEGGARFVVEDDGPGIPREEQDAIFEMFHTTGGGPRGGGTGIGLALVKKLVELRGGRVAAESRAPRGARFRVDWRARRS